jgi:phenylpropionate dioxygenase-like ring-hydroxylating dioxygenase large terminal subunit
LKKKTTLFVKRLHPENELEKSMPIETYLEDFDCDQEIEYSWTPPSSWYIEPDFLKAEVERVFLDHWVYLGAAAELQKPGDYVSYQVVDQPVVVTKGEDGQLRAFYNVCRHHAACVASGKGNAEVLTCPYHGWAYRLDGSLRRAPRLGKLENFNVKEFGLNPVNLEVWGELMFVHFGQPKKSVSETYPGLEDFLTQDDIGGLRFARRTEYELECNWKVFVDNYLDGGYHVEYLHPDLAAGLDLENYETLIRENFSIQQCKSAENDERLGRGAVYAYLYPNVMFNRYGKVLDINLVLPLGTDRCVVIFDYFFSPECSEQFIEEALKSSHQVQLEDVGICESVQRGLKSRGYDKGRYAPRIEQGELHFAKMLYRSLKG